MRLKSRVPKRFTKKFDLATNCSLGHSEFIGSQREAAVTRNRLEFNKGSHRRDEPPVSFGSASCRFHLAPSVKSGQRWLRILANGDNGFADILPLTQAWVPCGGETIVDPV